MPDRCTDKAAQNLPIFIRGNALQVNMVCFFFDMIPKIDDELNSSTMLPGNRRVYAPETLCHPPHQFNLSITPSTLTVSMLHHQQSLDMCFNMLHHHQTCVCCSAECSTSKWRHDENIDPTTDTLSPGMCSPQKKRRKYV